MEVRPTKATVIAYNVGFGDSLMLRFEYANARPRHILIDFGSTKAAFDKKPTLLSIANQIKADCGGKLDMVVATHRHADHISGFADKPGEIIKTLKPDVVVQPWTEHPDLETDATGPALAAPSGSGPSLAARRFAANLNLLNEAASEVVAQVPRIQRSKGQTKALAEQLQFIGETNIKNRPAIETLQGLGKRRVYASFGTDLKVDKLFPGVTIEVLGPPTLRQSKEIASMADTNADEFWHLAPAAGTPGVANGGGRLFPRAATTRTFPQEARWLIPQIQRMEGEEMLSLVRILDSVMNNTSLILLFTIGQTRLLFPGDAQLENWRYALEKAPNHKSISRRLASTKLYKVGHHGSLNATPRKMLWEKFTKTGPKSLEDRLITVLSTASGKHGSTTRGTEVPRKTLVEELGKHSELINTQECKPRTALSRTVELDL